MILSRTELAALNHGKRRICKVKAHERNMRCRSTECVRHKMVEDFAVRYTNHLERHGTVSRDRQHVNALHKLLLRYTT